MSERFTLVKKGYDPQAVDRYIATLEAQIESYRDKDKVIQNAIVSAQAAADGIIMNAKRQGKVIKQETAKQMEDISTAVSRQRTMLSEFSDAYTAVVSKYLRAVDNMDFLALTEKINNLENYLADFSDEVNEDLELENKYAAPPAPAAAPAPISPMAPMTPTEPEISLSPMAPMAPAAPEPAAAPVAPTMVTFIPDASPASPSEPTPDERPMPYKEL